MSDFLGYLAFGAMMGKDIQSGVSATKATKATKKATEAAAEENKRMIANAKAAEAKAGSQARESIVSRQRAVARNQTVYTSPLGLATEASTTRKTLLGQ